MPVFQFKCSACLAIFEHLVSGKMDYAISCVSCGGKELSRSFDCSFYPSKLFCPKAGGLYDRENDSNLSKIVASEAYRCNSGCASASCNNCQCSSK